MKLKKIGSDHFSDMQEQVIVCIGEQRNDLNSPSQPVGKPSADHGSKVSRRTRVEHEASEIRAGVNGQAIRAKPALRL
jgi:hypothetical protein